LRLTFFSIPYTFVSLVMILLYLCMVHGYITNLHLLHFTGRDVTNFLFATTMLLIFSLVMYSFIWNLLLDCGNQILPFIVDSDEKFSKFLNYIDKEKTLVGKNIVISMKKNERIFIFLVVLMIILILIRYYVYPIECFPGYCTWSE
jgi:hypothetical protein